tara:strand:- start:3844 stop:4092 length:249 start_codon:yes stop_codon:yes gene_type:complete
MSKEVEKKQKFFDLLIEQKKLLQTKISYADRLSKINEELRKIEIDISNTCIEEFGNHDYIEERESGMYGERFYICSRCNHMY